MLADKLIQFAVMVMAQRFLMRLFNTAGKGENIKPQRMGKSVYSLILLNVSSTANTMTDGI